MSSDTGAPGPGWYPDPWFTGQHRFWDGRVWTGDVFPHGPVAPDAPLVEARPDGQRPPAPPPSTRAPVAPPPPTWAYAAPAAPPTATAVMQPWELIESPQPERPRRRLTTMQINALALAAGLLIGFLVVDQLVSHHGHKPAAAQPVPLPFSPAPQPSLGAPNPAPSSTDRSAGLLQGLVVRQQDVRPTNQVELLTGGNQVSGQTTLDLCNGTFPSESLRTARLQVAESDLASTVLSTEAVLYGQAADAAQAMRELQTVVAHCPDNPVVSPVNEPTVTTQFGPAPDGSWPKVDGVQREAYSFTTTDQQGQTNDSIAVYLRRGRLLEGIYFPQPSGAQPPVNGQTTIAGIVHEFEERIAAVPAAQIGA